MSKSICILIALFGCVRLWSQVEPSASGGETMPDDETLMTAPPPVSGIAYPTIGISETRSNYLNLGLNFRVARTDNAFTGEFKTPLAETIYSILPSISMAQTTPRTNRLLAYTAGFTFYQPTSDLDSIDQSASGLYAYRISPRTAVDFEDTFAQTSDVFNQPFALSGGAVSGSGGGQPTVLIAPFGNRYMNEASAALTYQFGLNGMIGGGATSSLLNFANSKQNPGVYNSLSFGGSGFYSRRFSRRQYFGASLQELHITTSPLDSTIDTYTLSLFYTVYLTRTLSVSATAGAEYFDATEKGGPKAHGWTPAVSASLGWQTKHSGVALSYLRSVSGGAGLVGSYTTTSAGGSVGWQLTRQWNVGAAANYSLSKNETPASFSSDRGGHLVSGTATMGYTFREHLALQGGYSRLHEAYSAIASLAAAPDSNQEFVSVSYQFTRPLGR